MVPREDLPAAVTLGSIGFNIARAAGPALAGLVVASAGPAVTFLVNAVSFLGVLVVLFFWRRPAEEAMLPAERIWGAMTTGLRYVRHAPEVLAPTVRGCSFVFCGASLWALLPLVASGRAEGGAGRVRPAARRPRRRRGGGGRRPPPPEAEQLDGRVVAVATLVFAGATAALAYVEVVLAAGGRHAPRRRRLAVAPLQPQRRRADGGPLVGDGAGAVGLHAGLLRRAGGRQRDLGDRRRALRHLAAPSSPRRSA